MKWSSTILATVATIMALNLLSMERLGFTLLMFSSVDNSAAPFNSSRTTYIAPLKNVSAAGSNSTESHIGYLSVLSEESNQSSTYTIDNIIKTVKSLRLAPGRLLIYSPRNDTFLTYTIYPPKNSTGMRTRHADRCGRCGIIVPLLVRALVKARPQRFQPKQPIFQIFFSDADFLYAAEPLSRIEALELSPWLHFGSVYRNESIFPTVVAMPHPIYLRCLLEWSQKPSRPYCRSWRLPFANKNSSAMWSDLISQVVWRGSDYEFLPTVTKTHFLAENEIPAIPYFPRRIAIKLTEGSRASSITPWINASFSSLGKIKPTEMAKFRYQLDLGGAGGTSWQGTLEKLAMPGLLCHHETPSKDWYFYKDMIPWKHYVPVRTDLSNLKTDCYGWAESHPDHAQHIAESATKLAHYMMSREKMQIEYIHHFGSDQLGAIVDAYQGSNDTVERTLAIYSRHKLEYIQVATCNRQACYIRERRGGRNYSLGL